MKFSERVRDFILLLLLAIVPTASVLAEDVNNQSNDTVIVDKSEDGAKENVLPLTELRTFTKIFDHIRRSYVEEIDDVTLLNNAIKGLLSELDPHSAYLDESSYNNLQVNTMGEFGGLGIEVGMENGFVKVISPIDDTPAQKAGIEAGDIIIKLDEMPIKNMSLNQSVKMMRGEVGTKIVLTILREGVDQPLEITIIRDVIKVASVKVRMLEPNYAYVRIAQFQVNTGADLEEKLEDLLVENKKALSGVVLDLRNNPGGVLQASIEVADIFLEQGLIVSIKGRIANSEMEYKASEGDFLDGAPIVVLINEGSASASEIVAGALQDHSRGIILGTTSFGKGSVQTVIPINKTSAIKLTTARYFTPSGRSIQAQGIQPDIILEHVKIERVATNKNRILESDLARHLSNGSLEEDSSGDERDESIQDAMDMLEEDNQLYDALNILKAINIHKK